MGRETISSATLAAATGLTDTQIPPTKPNVYWAVVQAIGGNVRFTLDGVTAPVAATTGHILVQNGTVELWGDSELQGFSAITDGGAASLEVTYYGVGA